MSQQDEFSSLHPQTLEICEMFPDIPLDYISKILNETDGDFNKASEQLLNYGIISAAEEGINELKLDEVETPFVPVSYKKKLKPSQQQQHDKKRTIYKKRTSSIVDDKNNISKVLISGDDCIDDEDIQNLATILEDVDTIAYYLQLDSNHSDMIRNYYDENNKNVNMTIYEMIMNYNPYTKMENNKNLVETTISYSNILQKKDLEPFGDYIFDPNSKNFKELNSLKSYNSNLNLLNLNFYKNAMKFFKGDLDSILHVSFRLVDDKSVIKKNNLNLLSFKSSEHDYQVNDMSNENANEIEDSNDDDDEEWISISKGNNNVKQDKTSIDQLISESKRLINEGKTYKDKSIRSNYNNRAKELINTAKVQYEQDQSNLIKSLLRISKKENKVDLHGLSVSNSINCVDQSLKLWWDDELNLREVNLKSNSQQSNALFVSSFIIITGRGIHSGGGIGKIKNSVYKFLKDSGYVFEDITAGFKINGKKRYL